MKVKLQVSCYNTLLKQSTKYHMQSSKIFILCSILFFAACKKDSTTVSTSTTPAEGCTVQINPETGSIIAGRYIVAIAGDAGSRNLTPAARLQFNANLL